MRYNNVSRWVEKYGLNHQKDVRLLVEMESEIKKLIALQATIAELERVAGQKQLRIDFQSKMIDLASIERLKLMPIWLQNLTISISLQQRKTAQIIKL